jgi:hypothetical protein
MADSMHAAHIGGEKLLTSAAPVGFFQTAVCDWLDFGLVRKAIGRL